MINFDKDDFFNFLVATDQLDNFLGKKEEQKNEEENNTNDELVELNDFDDDNKKE